MNNDVNLKIGADGSDAIAEADRVEDAMTRWAQRVQEEIDQAEFDLKVQADTEAANTAIDDLISRIETLDPEAISKAIGGPVDVSEIENAIEQLRDLKTVANDLDEVDLGFLASIDSMVSDIQKASTEINKAKANADALADSFAAADKKTKRQGQSVDELNQSIQEAQSEADALQEKINADNARALQEVVDELAPSIRRGREELESLEEATESFKNTVQQGNDKITAGRAALEKYEAVAKKIAIAYGVALGLVTAIQAAIEAATGAQKDFNRAVENREGLERRAGFEKDRVGKAELDNAKQAEDPVAQIDFLLANAEEKAKAERKRLAAARDERDEREKFFAANPRKFFGVDRDAGLTDRLEQGPKKVEEAERRVFELRKARDEARAKVLKDQADAEQKAIKDKQKADEKAAREKEAADKKAKRLADQKVTKQKELNKPLERELSILKEKELLANGDKEGARKERNKRLSDERVDKFAALGKDKAIEAANALGAADGDRERAEERKKMLEERQKQLDKLAKLEEKMSRDDERRVKKMNKLFKEQKKIRDEANRPLGGFDEGFSSLNSRISASANSPNETVEKLQGVQDKIDEEIQENAKDRAKQLEAINGVKTAIQNLNVGMV